MGTLTTLRMKYLYILAFGAACFSAQKISDKNVDKINNAAIDQTRCAINKLNEFLNQGTHTKGIKVGQLIDIVGNQAMRNPQIRKFIRGFKPAEDGKQNSLPTVTTRKYLNDNEKAFSKACETLKYDQCKKNSDCHVQKTKRRSTETKNYEQKSKRRIYAVC